MLNKGENRRLEGFIYPSMAVTHEDTGTMA